MDPPPPRRPRGVPPTKQSVEYAGKYNPTSTADALDRARAKGNYVDLVTKSSASPSNTRGNNATSKKRKGDDVEKFSVPGGKRRQVAIYTANVATYCVTLQERWDQGAFRLVHKGRYEQNPNVSFDTAGVQMGKFCVLKEFKTGSVYEDSFFSKDILAVKKAASIIEQFNQHVSTHKQPDWNGAKTIYLNKPAVWQDVYPDSTGKYKKKMVEPMLEGEFLKFNSNSGYTNGAEFMQALSRFSYHVTNGQYLLCDLQGGHYEDCYVLTDPVIMSMDYSKAYGSGDLGSEGIESFFAHSLMNKYCCPRWLTPAKPRVSERIPKAANTSFSLTLGTLQSDRDRKRELIEQYNRQWKSGR